MATEQQLIDALRRADAGGDAEAAKAIARRIQSMRSQAPQQPKANIQDLYNRARSGDETALAEYNSRAKAVGQNTIEEELQANNPTTGGDNFLAGVGKSIYDTGRGIKQLFGGYTQEEIDQQRQADAPLMNTGAGIAGNIVGAGGQAFIPGAGVAKVTSGLGKIAPYAGAAVSGGLFAGSQPVGMDESRLGNTATGAALGVGGQALGAGAIGIAKGASDKLSPTVKKLYEQAKNAGIPIYPHQLSDNRMVKTLASFLGQFPLTGGAKANKQQIDAFTTMVSKTIGQNTDEISPAVLTAARDANSKLYNSVLDGVDIPIQSDVMNRLLIARNRAGKYTEAEKQMFDELIDEVVKNAPNGTLSGNVYQTLRQGWAKNSNQVSKEFRSIMEANTAKNIPADRVAGFKQANRMHGNIKTVEKAMQGADTPRAPTATEYKVNPATFRSAMGTKYRPSKEILTAARIGQKIKDPIADSGTAGRLLTAGGLGGAANVGGLAALSPLAKMIAIGATAGRTINSKAMANYMANGSPRPIQGLARLIENTAPRTLPAFAVAGAKPLTEEEKKRLKSKR